MMCALEASVCLIQVRIGLGGDVLDYVSGSGVHVGLNKLTGIGNITNTYGTLIIQILHLNSIPNTSQ
jgi:hypothetical protein